MSANWIRSVLSRPSRRPRRRRPGPAARDCTCTRSRSGPSRPPSGSGPRRSTPPPPWPPTRPATCTCPARSTGPLTSTPAPGGGANGRRVGRRLPGQVHPGRQPGLGRAVRGQLGRGPGRGPRRVGGRDRRLHRDGGLQLGAGVTNLTSTSSAPPTSPSTRPSGALTWARQFGGGTDAATDGDAIAVDADRQRVQLGRPLSRRGRPTRPQARWPQRSDVELERRHPTPTSSKLDAAGQLRLGPAVRQRPVHRLPG